MKKSSRNRQRHLEELVGTIVSMLDPDPKEVCNQTGLCLTTVKRYMDGNITLDVHYNTLDLLARAAGLDLEVVQQELRKVHHG